MTWVARELPRGSGKWRAVNEPGRPHPREAPQFECSMCDRVIGKKRTLVVLKDRRVICPGCLGRHNLYGAGVIDHFSTRAALAVDLGIWPGKPDAAKVSFRQWLKQFSAERSAIGDLARDVYADSTWPRGRGSLARYETYLDEANADENAVTTLRRAWKRYEDEKVAEATQ